MGKKFEEMSFDELKLYRREGLWRSIGLLIETIVLIISNRNHFRIIGFMITLGLLSYIRPIFGANQVMRNHPDWIRKSGFKAKIPLPKEWHIKRFCVIGVSLIVIIVSFFFLYKP